MKIAKRSRLLRSGTSFLRDKSGNFGLLAAIVIPVVLVGAGSALDYSVANSERTNLQQIADAAALSGGGVFDGTNLSEAKKLAERYIKAQVGAATKPAGAAAEGEASGAVVGNVSYEVTAVDRTLKVEMTKRVPTTLMQIAAIKSVKVSVSASALSPLKPEKITFEPIKAQGWYYKKISILVLREGATKEVVLGTVTYQPTTQNDGGQGTYVAEPSGVIDLGKYSTLALRMDIKEDGCNIGYKASVDKKTNAVTCSANSGTPSRTYNTVLRTDDPTTSNYLFVDKKQVPVGVKASLEKYFGCTKRQEHAWEDGGGWERQDFFYNVTSSCGADGAYVRLMK